jgi:polysaccharide biosynthesis transport protein
MPQVVASKTITPDPLHDSLRQRYLDTKVSHTGALARRDAVARVIAQVDSELAGLPSEEKELAQLEIDQEAAEQTYRLLRQKLDEARIRESESKNASAIKLIDEAYVFPVDQRKVMKLGLALLLSPMLGVAIVFLLHYLDNTVRNPAEAEELLALPVFAVVPLSKPHSLARAKRPTALAEIYQILSANLWSNLDFSRGACLVVAGAEPDSGRSITASNLAITLAADGARVILVDADFRQPAQHLLFGVDNRRGLSNILSGGALIEDVLRPTKFDGLLLMTAGPIPDNPVRLLRSQQMRDFVDHIGSVADFVVFDSPSGVAFADSAIIASYVRNVLIVHAAGRVSRGAEAEFRNRLEQFGVNLTGAVLNMAHPEDSHGFFHYRRAYQDVLPPRERHPREVIGIGAPRSIPTEQNGYGTNDR